MQLRRVDGIILGSLNLEDQKLDFGVIDPQGNINGLLGLDILIKANINLKRFTMTLGDQSFLHAREAGLLGRLPLHAI